MVTSHQSVPNNQLVSLQTGRQVNRERTTFLVTTPISTYDVITSVTRVNVSVFSRTNGKDLVFFQQLTKSLSFQMKTNGLGHFRGILCSSRPVSEMGEVSVERWQSNNRNTQKIKSENARLQIGKDRFEKTETERERERERD